MYYWNYFRLKILKKLKKKIFYKTYRLQTLENFREGVQNQLENLSKEIEKLDKLYEEFCNKLIISETPYKSKQLSLDELDNFYINLKESVTNLTLSIHQRS